MKSIIDSERVSYVRWPTTTPTIRNERRRTSGRIVWLLLIGAALVTLTRLVAGYTDYAYSQTRSPQFILNAASAYRGIEEMESHVKASPELFQLAMRDADREFKSMLNTGRTPQEWNTFDVLLRYMHAVGVVRADQLDPYDIADSKLKRDLAEMAHARKDACLVIPGR